VSFHMVEIVLPVESGDSGWILRSAFSKVGRINNSVESVLVFMNYRHMLGAYCTSCVVLYMNLRCPKVA
jgi:hypothetical protein